MDPDLLQELEAATAAFVSAAESNDVDQAAKLLALRGELLNRLAAESGPLTMPDRETLLRVLDSGRTAILPLTARRYWLDSKIADARKDLQAQNSLRPFREKTSGRLNVTS